ncbi:MAG: HlyD family efflux transporter periplasmic adaptor subunit [Deltaproteobacteria bacterium]
MKKRILLIAVFVIVSASLFFFFSKKEEKAKAVSTTGIIEGTEVNLSSKASGRISEFCCKEGDRVSAGHAVARLDSDDIRASVEQAMAGVIRAKADIGSSEAAVRNSEANLKSAEAEIKSAEADMERLKVQMEEELRQRERKERLYEGGFISKSEMDLGMTSYESSKASYNASDARLRVSFSKKDAAASQLNSSVSLLASAKARLKEAEAALKFQEARLKDTEILSPISGTVVFKGMEAGEVVSPGVTILSIVDLEDLWVRADIEETLIGRVRVRDEAAISIDGMPGISFKGTVAEIGREADFATLKDVTRGRQDIKTFRVKLKMEDKTGTLKPGMTVKVKLHLP